MTPLVALTDARLTFGGRPLLEGVDLALGRGDRACLVGRNGVGKSTLLKAIAGAIELDGGSRFVQPGTRIAYLPQEPVATPGATVGYHVAAGLWSEMTAHRVAAFTDRLRLDPARPLEQLSGGEMRRADLARALVGEPEILLLDEPTNHLDPASVDMLTDALSDFPGTIIFISHDPTFLTRVCTRVIEIEEGKARSFAGDYEYYLWKKAQEVESIKETSDELKGTDRGSAASPTRAMASQVQSNPSAGDRRDLNKTQARLEKQVARAEAEI
ncbi:MAG: ATP-binding cassette domain-containing protein, partial [Rhodospirillales bacterium]|nr:ATP-binding cassette domain-containing protein [Rhodospirillales bacterium]